MQQLRSAIHNAIARFLKNQPPARIIAVGFALLILLGAALLMLPFAVHPGAHVGPLDALFTATSAVCVTGPVSYTHLDVYKRQKSCSPPMYRKS